ncbi:hypothetical protein BGZ67_001184 [Mortierella alpina]|nr:hypothetical protein BGZ67_001184 [Mortierella alpina]
MHENSSHSHLQARTFWSNLAQGAPSATPTTPSSPSAPKIPPKKPTKRIRISTACVNCRHKKIKCDGQVPCAHCEKFRAECVYPVATKPANQEYVETLENRLKSVESHLHGLLSRGWGKGATGQMAVDGDALDLISDDAETPSPYTPASIPASPPAKHPNGDTHSSSPFNSQPRHSRTLSLSRQFSGASISTPALTGTDSESEDTTFTKDDSMEVLGLLMGSLKIARDGAAQYIPNALGQKERTYNDSRVYSSSSSNTAVPDFTALDWESTEPPSPYTLPSALLAPKAIGALLDIYFNSVHTFLPVIHKTSFLTLCQDNEYRVPPFLLMAICAVAARHATDFELQEIPELSNLKSHHALYDHARALLDTFMDVPRLSTVQGLLLLAYYQTKEKRSGHFFRIRLYVDLATRMALDMGLHRTLHKNLKEVETDNSEESLPSIGATGYHNRPTLGNSNIASAFSSLLTARQNEIQHNRETQGQLSLEKRSVIHQENRLAWLGCFFLDGLISSLMGQEYCVANAVLDMRSLIEEASQMTDTVQGATLIFWYHHLELVQIYRQVCVFHRAILNERALSRAIKGADMRAIESSLEEWLLNLPAHLVYVDTSQQGPGAALPSYYTLYLHRFFYSHRLLLYRPLISNKAHRGELRDSRSPLAKCAEAALKLTQIGEIIFQNYSWPWPGCGLFAYHMLQAAEIHVFQMVNQSTVDSQSLYYRTMDLIKGYVSLARLPDLEKDIMAMEEMVSSFLLAPSSQEPATSEVNPSPSSGAYSHQQQPQHMVATPASDYSYASVMSPASPVESVQRMPMGHHRGDNDMFSPLQNNAYPSFETASRTFRPPQNIASTMGSSVSGFPAPSSLPSSNGFSVGGFDMQNDSSVAGGHAQVPSSSGMYDASSAMPFYNSTGNTTGSGPMNMFGGASHQTNGLSYGQPSFLQPTLTPVGDLLGLGHGIDNRVFHAPTSTPTIAPGSSAGTASQSQPFSQTVDPTVKKSTLPPPKPPKRVLSQSTGSSSSSSMSQSGKPPVPKKPTRLTEIAPAQPRWIAPRPNSSGPTTPTLLIPPTLPVPLVPSNSGADMYYGGKPASSNSHNMPPPSYPSSGPIALPANHGRPPIKVLQPQTTLYGMGTLVNSLGVEQQVHAIDDDMSTAPSERSYYDDHEHALHYLQMNPQLYDPVPPNNRRQLI